MFITIKYWRTLEHLNSRQQQYEQFRTRLRETNKTWKAIAKLYYKGKTKILYIDYNDITKHVLLQDVMGHAVNKLYI